MVDCKMGGTVEASGAMPRPCMEELGASTTSLLVCVSSLCKSLVKATNKPFLAMTMQAQPLTMCATATTRATTTTTWHQKNV